jgi:hypothetical protein
MVHVQEILLDERQTVGLELWHLDVHTHCTLPVVRALLEAGSKSHLLLAVESCLPALQL